MKRFEELLGIRFGRFGFHPNGNEKPLKGFDKRFNVIKYAFKIIWPLYEE